MERCGVRQREREGVESVDDVQKKGRVSSAGREEDGARTRKQSEAALT